MSTYMHAKRTLLVLAVVLAGCVTASAGEPPFICRDFVRRNCWPQPFACAERPTVRTPFCIQVANGWERQNLLGDSYFEPDTSELTEAGRLKLQWIVLDSPEQHRMVFVHRGTTAEQTANRLAIVRQRATEIAGDGFVPPVISSNMSDQGRSAEWIDRINRKFISSAPEPKLPSSQQGGSGGGGSGSGT